MLLVNSCLEILGLWNIVCDHQFEVVCAALTEAQVAQLKSCTLRSLLSSGNEQVGLIQLHNTNTALCLPYWDVYLDCNSTLFGSSRVFMEVVSFFFLCLLIGNLKNATADYNLSLFIIFLLFRCEYCYYKLVQSIVIAHRPHEKITLKSIDWRLHYINIIVSYLITCYFVYVYFST